MFFSEFVLTINLNILNKRSHKINQGISRYFKPSVKKQHIFVSEDKLTILFDLFRASQICFTKLHIIRWNNKSDKENSIIRK